jgi:hypothetical protein
MVLGCSRKNCHKAITRPAVPTRRAAGCWSQRIDLELSQELLVQDHPDSKQPAQLDGFLYR